MVQHIEAQPYFWARVNGQNIETRGLASYSAGHKINYGMQRKSDGIFAEWGWDGKTLSVRNDRYGFYPLFYYERAGEICVSPHLIRLIMEGAPTELDFDALSVFLRLGYFIGDDTPFKAIRVVPPNACFVWENARLTISGGYAFRKAQSISRQEALETYVALFRQAVQRRLPANGDFAVLLSGGRDSRHILLELCEQGRPPEFCLSAKYFLPLTNADIEVASLLAERVHVTHIALDQPESFLQAEVEKNIRTHFCSDEHAWILVLADYLSGKVSTMFDGIGGDILSAGLYQTPQRLAYFESGRFSELAEEMLPTDKEYPLSILVVPDIRSKLDRNIARIHLMDELKKHADAPNQTSSFLFWNRTRREISLSPYAILSDIRMVFSPYLDHDLYDFLASLPAEVTLDHQFHTDAIRRAFPQYQDVPFAEKDAGSPVDPTAHHRRFRKDLARYLLRHVLRSSFLVRKSFLIPRALRCLLSQKYCDASGWLFTPVLLYLFQLEQLAETRSLALCPGSHVNEHGGPLS